VLDFELGPFFLFFGMFVAAGLGAPIPEEVAIVAAGLWTANSPEYGLARWLMLPVCIIGIIIADMLLYSIGRWYGARLLEHEWLRRLLNAERREGIERNFHRYGVNILLVGRLLPGIRAPLFITAGMMRLSIPRFLLADSIGAILGNSLLFFLAFWFGDQFKVLIDRAEGTVEKVRPILILTAILAVGIYFLVHFLRRPVTTGDPKELPLIGEQVAARIDHEKTAVNRDEKGSDQPPAVSREPRATGGA
jgi:membrane protein DedA with SNARE-associated domain